MLCLRGLLSKPIVVRWRLSWYDSHHVFARDLLKDLGHKPNIKDETTESTLSALAEEHHKLERENGGTIPAEVLRRLDLILACFRLSDLEGQILLLALLVRREGLCKEFSQRARLGTPTEFHRIIADMLCAPVSAVSKALQAQGKLLSSGLVCPQSNEGHVADLEDYLMPVSGLSWAVLTSVGNKEELLHRLCPEARLPALPDSAFDHFENEFRLMSRLLQGGLRDGARGINILLYGPPGTGKTEMARALVQAVGGRASEVTEIDNDGDPLSVTQRVSRYQFALKLLSICGGGAVVFDEIENILGEAQNANSGNEGRSGRFTALNKAWKVRILEDNAVPAVWVGNNIDSVDPALLRRFSFSLQVGVPPRAKREALIREAFEGQEFPPQLIRRIADQPDLVPADISRTKQVLSLVSGNEQASISSSDLSTVMAARPGGIRRILASSKNGRVDLPYRLEWIHSDIDLSTLAKSMGSNGFGRLGLFGPPGTGKTAFVTNLAAGLGVNCVTKKASEFMSPYIGVTEQRFAEAFREAHDENALLFIDEADSYLRSRDGMQRSWEFSQVNELLTQIDEYEGYLALASNYGDQLDAALARRLDLKVQLRPLRGEHLVAVFLAACTAIGIEGADAAATGQLDALHASELTLGDVAAAMRQARLLAETPEPETLLRCLRSCVAHKMLLAGRPIGFGACV